MSISLHRLVSWFSPAFPIGAFSYSHGLEAAIIQGDVVDGATLRAWLIQVVQHGSGWNDCLLVAAAYRATSANELSQLSDLADALAAGMERQFESRQQGNAFAKTVSAVSAHDFSGAPLPIVVGQVGAKHDILLPDLLAVFMHTFVSNLISATSRAMALGQVEAQQVLASMFDTIDQVVGVAITSTIDDIGGSCFLADLASMQHETLQPRIFRT